MAIGNDLAPHAAIIQISWSVHEKRTDGSFHGSVKEDNKVVLSVEGGDRALTNEYVKSIIDLIKRNVKNVSEIEIDAERLGEAQLQGVGRPRQDSPEVFGMRGTIGRNSVSRPKNGRDV